MSFYEHTIVAKQDLSTADIDGMQKKYDDIITGSNGKVIKIEKWGLINFARKIKSYKKGFFIHYKFEGDKNTINEIKKNSVIDNSILRHLTIKYKKLDTEIEYFQEKAGNEKKK
ncbi:MAG: small subunit ribosomal protein S6 [Pelagibacterales bacterium]|jgi:small subunit ribosomal protein S6|nr:small subunit ribosomal protein S6 [Pelagibacterales bacterium]